MLFVVVVVVVVVLIAFEMISIDECGACELRAVPALKKDLVVIVVVEKL